MCTCNLNLLFIAILGILRDKENEADTATESRVQQRRLTNHSARRFMLQKLDDCGFEHNHIKQISGHKNIQSVSNYAKLSAKKHQEISSNLLGKTTTCSSNVAPTISNSQQINILSPQSQAHDENLPRHFETISKSTTSVGRAASLFAGPVYGGTFHIYMNEGGLPPPKRRRPMIIESSSDDSQ